MAILKQISTNQNKEKKLFRSPFSFESEDNEAPQPTEKNVSVSPSPKMRKKKKGRPKIDKDEKRTKSVSVVITDIESKKLCKLVKKSRLSKSEYIRRLILQAIDKNIYHL